jgi:predicted enzyme related to lactoylglutathione lyase
MTSNNVVGWFEIYVSDMARARAFYTAVFDKELQALPALGDSECEMWAFPWVDEAPGAAGALVKHAMRGPAQAAGSIVYFSCQDVAIESARAEAAGGMVILPRMAIGPYGFIALIADSEGNTIGLHSMQ